MLKPILVAVILALAAFNKPAFSQEVTKKLTINQFLAPAAGEIAAHLANFKPQPGLHVSQYYTPLYRPGPDGKLDQNDRHNCLILEGACIVGDLLYNYPHTIDNRKDVPYKFGKTNGHGPYNATNALDPCRTVAADLWPKRVDDKVHEGVYPVGTVIFIPKMRNKICPQSGKPVDGAFIVSDEGRDIIGKARFDLFPGECILYDKGNCNDPGMKDFSVPDGSPFYVIPRDNPLAKQLREQTDAFIKRGWQ